MIELLPLFEELDTGDIWIDYDRGADVLYVSFRRPQDADDSELTEEGVIYRYRGKQLVGITILNVSKRFAAK
ncbi:MAG TPA: DUF2283 domain-containing protein [Anaerolineae bacterium]|nr:DUF2283 domain-containing protein [Anaerolineae bacterium]